MINSIELLREMPDNAAAMDPYKEVAKAITETLVLIATADGRVHEREQKILITTLKEIWNPSYGSIKCAMVSAFREAKMARDFELNVEKVTQTHAILLSKIFTRKEKEYFLRRITLLVEADRVENRNELKLFSIVRLNIKPGGGFLGSLKSSLGSIFG